MSNRRLKKPSKSPSIASHNAAIPSALMTSSVLGIGVPSASSGNSARDSINSPSFFSEYSYGSSQVEYHPAAVNGGRGSDSKKGSIVANSYFILACSIVILMCSIAIHVISFSHDWTSSTKTFMLDLPTLLLARVFYLLQWSLTFTLTLNFYSFSALLLLAIPTSYYLFQYLSHFNYSKSSGADRIGETPIGLKPEDGDGVDAVNGMKNHPVEFLGTFLSSIKVFGYLDKDVFNELAMNLTQVTLEPDEVLFDKEIGDRSFYVVLEGCIRLYVEGYSQASQSRYCHPPPLVPFNFIITSANFNTRTSALNMADISASHIMDEDADSDSHLLNEIKAGGTVSSLFNILSIFTDTLDNAKVNGSEDDHKLDESERDPIGSVHMGRKQVPLFPGMRSTEYRKASTIPSSNPESKANFDILAKAHTATTLLVIPEEAFQSLALKYPTSAAHIVQVILTRFQRVRLSFDPFA